MLFFKFIYGVMNMNNIKKYYNIIAIIPVIIFFIFIQFDSSINTRAVLGFILSSIIVVLNAFALFMNAILIFECWKTNFFIQIDKLILAFVNLFLIFIFTIAIFVSFSAIN